MTLREIIEQAASDIDTYKNPSISKAQEWIDRLLKAGKLGGVSHDRIEQIYMREGMVVICTSYSVRSCEQTARYTFPEHVLDAKDPMDAISAWAWGERVGEAQEKVDEVVRMLECRQKCLAEAQAELQKAMIS